MKHSASPLKQILLAALPILLLTAVAMSVFVLYAGEPTQSGSDGLAAELPSRSASEEDAAEVSATARRRGVQNFLLCGKDRASGLCDVIIVAQLDTVNHAASLVQIPRDTYADYTEKSYRKLNGAPSALGGVKGLSAFLTETLGIPIDHYALVDLDCIGDVVDAIGGVTLTVPTDMDYEDIIKAVDNCVISAGDYTEQLKKYSDCYRGM